MIPFSVSNVESSAIMNLSVQSIFMEEMPEIHIGIQSIRKLLMDFKHQKATAANDIVGVVLKKLPIRSCWLSFSIIFKERLRTNCFP